MAIEEKFVQVPYIFFSSKYFHSAVGWMMRVNLHHGGGQASAGMDHGPITLESQGVGAYVKVDVRVASRHAAPHPQPKPQSL